jgi:hypothetical protein
MVLLFAAAVVAAALCLVVRFVPALSAAHLREGFLGFRPYRRRLLSPQPRAVLDCVGEIALVGLVAFVSRKILRLHL